MRKRPCDEEVPLLDWKVPAFDWRNVKSACSQERVNRDAPRAPYDYTISRGIRHFTNILLYKYTDILLHFYTTTRLR